MTTIDVCPIGGYDEVGRNSTAVKIGDTVILFDIGLHMEEYIKHQESGKQPDYNTYIKNNVIPNTKIIGDWKDKVKLIAISHGHLDHVGAVPFVAPIFPKIPILGTPYTIEILQSLCKDRRIVLGKRVKQLNKNQKFVLTDQITIEFINVTHSIPQTVIIATHTPKGTILYALDFKFDLFPVIGTKTNPERLKALKNVHALIVESLYAREHKKMPSESVAKLLLRDIMFGPDVKDKALFITTFASHIARLREIIQFAEKLDRKVILLGRSLVKYVTAAEKVNIVRFSEKVEMYQYTKQIKKVLKKVENNPEDYIVVVTGHQGEKDAVLSRIVRGELPFEFLEDDVLIFAAPAIPTQTTIYNRRILEEALKKKKLRIYKDIHVSGHGAGEDLKDLILMTRPKHIIPAHGDISFRRELASIAKEMGYKVGKTVHLLNNGQKKQLP